MTSPQLGQNEFGAMLSYSQQVTAAVSADPTHDVTMNLNPDFEVDLSDWSGFNGAFTRANDRARIGSWSGKFVPNGASTVCGYSCSEMVATPGTWYRVKGWLNGGVAGQFVQLKADWRDAVHGFIGGGSVVSTAMVAANNWTYFSGLVLSPPLTAFTQLAVIMEQGAVIPASNIFWGDDLRYNSVDNTAVATATIAPRGENWDIRRLSVIASSNTLEASAFTYRGLIGQPYLLESSFAGSSGDSSDTGIFLRDGEAIHVQWVGGDIDATYTVTVNGWRTTPRGGFRSAGM